MQGKLYFTPPSLLLENFNVQTYSNNHSGNTMKHLLSSVVNFITLFSVISIIMCGSMPTGELKDTSNVFAKMSILNPDSAIVRAAPLTIRMIIRYPDLVKNIRVSFDSTFSDTLVNNIGSNEIFDTLFFTRTFGIAGAKSIKADFTLADGTIRTFTHNFTVKEKKFDILIRSFPVDHKIEALRPDTLVFGTITDSTCGHIAFTTTVYPALDTNVVKVLQNDREYKVIITAPDTGMYSVLVHASCGISSDSSIVKLTSCAKPSIQELSSVAALNSGTSDSLYFTVDKKSAYYADSLVLLNLTAFKSGEISQFFAQSDTLGIIFTPVENKTYVFVFEAAFNGKKDTLSYSISVARDVSESPERDAVTINATEGMLVEIPLMPYLYDTAITDTCLIPSKGNVTNRILGYTVPYGSKAGDTLTVNVTGSNSESRKINIYLNVNSSDTTKPLIMPVTPADSIYTTGESVFVCRFRITDSNAGVGKVEFFNDTAILTDTAHSDSIYDCTVKNLTHGQRTFVKVRATDKSLNKNMDSLTICLVYDSTLADSTGPVIALMAKGTDVSSSSVNIELLCKDNNGVANVTCKLGTVIQEVEKTADSTFMVKVNGLQPGENRILISAIDRALKSNQSDSTIIIYYKPEDTLPPAINLLNPIVNGGRILADTVTAKILCTDVNGIESVVCRHGSEIVGVIKESDSVYSAKVSGLLAGGADSIHFIVKDKSARSNESVFLLIVNFAGYQVLYDGNGNTAGAVPVDSVLYLNSQSVNIQGNSGNLQKNGCKFTGWNTLPDGTGTNYTEGSLYSVSSSNVILFACWEKIPVYSRVLYDGNENQTGTVPADDSLYEPGDTALVKDNSGNLHRFVLTFTGWNTSADGSGTEYAAGSMIIIGQESVILYAQYKNTQYFTVKYDSNGSTSGTVPLDYGMYRGGTYVPVKGNTGNLEKSGFWFNGWDTNPEGSGITYYEGSNIEIAGENVVLYARWIPN